MPLRKIYGIISQNRMKILIRSSWIWWQGQKVMLYTEFQLHSSLATPCRFSISSELIVHMCTAFRFNFPCWSKFSWFGFQSWSNLPNFEAYIFSQSILRFFLFSLMTRPLNTQNEWIIWMLIGAVAGFCLFSLDVKEEYTNQSHESIKHAKKSILLLLARS